MTFIFICNKLKYKKKQMWNDGIKHNPLEKNGFTARTGASGRGQWLTD